MPSATLACILEEDESSLILKGFRSDQEMLRVYVSIMPNHDGLGVLNVIGCCVIGLCARISWCVWGVYVCVRLFLCFAKKHYVNQVPVICVKIGGIENVGVQAWVEAFGLVGVVDVGGEAVCHDMGMR